MKNLKQLLKRLFCKAPVSGSANDEIAEQHRRNLTDKYIDTHCGNYTDKEKIQARNAVQIGWEMRKHYR
jgi:hypothetical protein